jgi:lambda repressor-like predicted transcriptional regulator
LIGLEEWVDIVSRRAAGQSIKSIGRELGVSRNTVRATLRREGPPRYERAAAHQVPSDWVILFFSFFTRRPVRNTRMRLL